MSLASFPDPWAFCLLLALLPLLALRVLPAAAQLVGRSMSRSASPVASVLVLPEFWVVSLLRRRGGDVPAAVHAYDRVVEVVYRGMRSTGPLLTRLHGPTRRLHPLLAVVPVVLVLLLWYGEPFLPDGGLRTQAVAVKCTVLRVDDELTGGSRWTAPNAVCPVPPVTASVAPPGSPLGRLDVARRDGGQLVAAGWAVDRSDPDKTVQVQVHVDVGAAGSHAVAVPAQALRPDVAQAVGVGPRTGFAAFLPIDAGEHELCAYAMDNDGGRDALLGCREIAALP